MGTQSTPDASSAAMTELAELIAAIEADSHHPRWKFTTLQDRASYREFAMHSLQHALQFWLEADPARPCSPAGSPPR
jgi:hypothetical protein